MGKGSFPKVITKTKKTGILQITLTVVLYVVLTSVSLGFFIASLSYSSVVNSGVVKMAVSSSLVGFWDFNEASGNIALDAIGGHNGSIFYSGQATPSRLASGVKGSALNFNSYRSYVDVGNNFSDVKDNKITVSYWVKLNQLPNDFKNELNQPVKYPNLISKANSYYHYFGTEAGWGTGTVNRNKLIIKWIDKNGGSHDGVSGNISNTVFATGVWYHIAWVFDGSTSKLYVNGNLENTTNVSLLINPSIGQLTFSSFGNSFNGSLDEVKIYNTALGATKINDIYKSNNCSLDPFSVDCIYYCNSKNDANNPEKLGCMKNSCDSRYGASSTLAVACADTRRVSFNPFEAMYKVYYYCQEPGNPNSEDCLFATGYMLNARDNLLKSSCDYKNPGNPGASYSCFQTAKYGTYNTINTLVNCSDLSNPDVMNECTYYLGFSTSDNNVYDQRAQDICNMFGNCSTVVAPTKQNYGYASEAQAQSKASASSLSDILNELKKKYVDGYCLDPTFLDPCGPIIHHGRYNFLRVGQLASCHAICDSEMLGQPCSSLFAANKPNRRLLNSYAQSIVEGCANYSWPESSGKCAGSCVCNHASEACDGKPDCDPNAPKVCHTCFTSPVSGPNANGMYSINVLGQNVVGTSDFVTNVQKWLNKLDTDSRDGCKPLPDGCVLARSYDSSEKDHSSAHFTGIALDICCSGTPNATTCNMPNVDAMLGKVSGFNAIRECTKKEKDCNGTQQCSGGMVHIDNKSHGSGQPTEGCVYKNCDWPSSSCQ